MVTVAAASSAVRPDASLAPVRVLGMGRAIGTVTVPRVVFAATELVLSTGTMEVAEKGVQVSAQAMTTRILRVRAIVQWLE